MGVGVGPLRRCLAPGGGEYSGTGEVGSEASERGRGGVQEEERKQWDKRAGKPRRQ